ncbi:MAG: extracellular solute-binding protein [Eubacteriales bacterium]|nr:extracellular solute-binding protein [Eubacteriales bacterium]
MRKQVTLIVMLLVLAMLAVACTGGGATTTTAGTTKATTTTGGTTGTTAAPAMYPWHEEGVVLKLVRNVDVDITRAGITSYAEAPGFKAWQEQTGISIDITETADDTALKLLLSSGDLPDIIVASRTFYAGGQLKMAEDGLAIPLTDEFANLAPDFWSFINSDPIYFDSLKQADGEIYCFQGFFLKDSPYRSWRGMMVRQDFLDQVDLEPPTTIDEFTAMLRAFKDQLEIETPLMSFSGNFPRMLSDGNLTAAFGLPNSIGYQVDGVYHFGAYEPAYKEALAYLNMLYDEGLMDKNFAVTDEPTAQSSVMEGKTGAIYAAASRILNMTSAVNDGVFKLTGLPPFTKNKGEVAICGMTDPVMVSTASWLTEDCENVPAACAFLNYLYTEPGNLLYNFGIEGESFEYVDGKPKFTELMTKNPDGYSLDPMIRKYGILNFSGVQDLGMSAQRFPLQEQIDAYAAWSSHTADKYMIINNAILAEYMNEEATLWTDIDTYINEMRARFISGQEPLENFDQYITTLKNMGMDRLIEIRQLSLDKALGK